MPRWPTTRGLARPEGILDVFEDRLGALAAELDADHVEPGPLPAAGECRVPARPGEPGRGQPDQAVLLRRTDGKDRSSRSGATTGPEGLDLDEDEGSTVEANQVEFSRSDAPVPRQEAPAQADQVAGRQPFGPFTDRPARVVGFGAGRRSTKVHDP